MIAAQFTCVQFNDAQFNSKMPTIRPPRLARPCVLSRIKPASVQLLLEPFAPYFAARGTPLDSISDKPEGLRDVMLTLADPVESTPPELVERLELLDLLCDPRSGVNFEDAYGTLACSLAQPDDTPEDLAARIIVHAPDVAWREFDRQALRARRSFRSYSVDPSLRAAAPDADRIASLERVMRPWFEKSRRSGTCQVHVRQGSTGTSFVIRHGDPLRRLSVIADDGSQCSRILRPERVDIAHWRPAACEWLISGCGRAMQEMYRQAFGLVFHESADALCSAGRYSLEPLRAGKSALWCRSGDPVQAAELVFLKLQLPDASKVTVSGGDAFGVLRVLGSAHHGAATLLEARIDLKLSMRRRILPVVLRPLGSRPSATDHEETVTRWLADRRFIAMQHENLLLESA